MAQLYFSGHQQAGFGAPAVWGQPDNNAALAALFSGYGGAQMPNFGQPMEIMGALEIIGDPTAPPAAKSAAISALAQAALANKAGAVRVQQTMPERGYEQILPCTSLAVVQAAGPRDITLTPQRTFKPTRFRASSTYTAPFFQINSYTIGAEPQFIAPGGVPCDLFSEVAFYSQTDGETANLGNIITLQVQNIDPLAQNRDFRAAFFGIALPVH
jgi:hypothetical protein